MSHLPVERLEDLGLSLPSYMDLGGMGAGALGTVERHPTAPHRVVKLYRDSIVPRGHVLEAIAALATPSAAHLIVDAHVCLPLTLVNREVGGMRVCCGYTMADAGDRFRREAHSFGNPQSVLLDVQHLTRPANAASLGLPVPGEDVRLMIADQILETLAALHDLGWLAQDMLSETNVLWTNSPDPAARFIDSDSMRPEGGLGAVEASHSVNYEPTEWPADQQCRASDVWKAGLMCGRVLAADSRWPQVPDPLSVGNGRVARLLLDAVAPGRDTPRPTMRQLADSMKRALANAGLASSFLPFVAPAVGQPAHSSFTPFATPLPVAPQRSGFVPFSSAP